MDAANAPSTITIAPLGDDDDEDGIITDETPGRTNTLDLTSLDPAMTIKTEPVEKPPPVATIVTPQKDLTTVFAPRQPAVATIRQATSLLRNLVPVTRGVFRFSSPGSINTTAGGHLLTTTRTPGQMILIPTTGSNCTALTLGQNQAPIKLIPIQPKKSQAVVAPQAKQTVVVSATPVTPASSATSPMTVVPPEMRKGIISFSSEKPDDLFVRRSTKIFNPKYGVSGMIFNSRTVTAGGRVRYTKDYLCNLCKHMSDSYTNFKQHFSSTHMFNCDYCDYKAFSRYEVVIHTKLTHAEAVDDLKGYEMFEVPDSIVSTVTVMPPQTLAGPTNMATAKLTTNTSLVTVPVLATAGDKLVIQTGSRAKTATTNTVIPKPSSILPPNTSPDSPIGSYFTYKIVYGGSKNEPKKYECDLCQYQTVAIAKMYEHASSHTMADLTKTSTSSTTWECYYCNFKSPHQPNVVQHVTMVHPDKHIQLKRYTSTSVIRSTVLPTSTTSTLSQSTPGLSESLNTSPTKKSLLLPGTSLIIKQSLDAIAQKIVVSTTSSQNQNKPLIPTTVNISDDDTSPAKPAKDATKSTPEGVREKTSKDVDEEDDGTAMWGCYYCDFEDQDRHNVVAHVKADHTGRKIVITRRRLPSKDGKDEKEPEKTPEENEDLLLEKLKKADSSPASDSSGRKNYESLIIKLKTSNKTDKKMIDSIQSIARASNASDSEGPDLPSLDNGIKELLSGGEGTDPEMPTLEKMVPGQNSPRVGTWTKPKSGPDKKKITGTRVKSDLAFDQAEVVFLDHIPDDLNVDVSQLYVYNKGKQEAECNICQRTYKGKMAASHMREHLMIHTGERIWGCPYCDFCCNRRFALYTHVKRVHPDQPIKLVRRRPYQLGAYKAAGRRDPGGIQYKHRAGSADDLGSLSGKAESQKPRLRGPRTHREREFLESSDVTWTCPYCTRKDVFKGAIKIHMKTVHPDQDADRDPEKDERPMELLRKLIAENQLPMKEAKIELFKVEDMDRYKVLRETLEENAENLTHDLDLEDVERATMPVLTPASTDVKPKVPMQMTMMRHAKYQCPYCPTRGVRPSTVKSHIIANHPEKELYIHDLRVSRRSNNQHHLFVCRDQDCKFMTVMKQALYAHVAKNPTHINTGLVLEGESLDELALAPRVPSLRVRKHENYNDDDISKEIVDPPVEKKSEPPQIKSPVPLTVESAQAGEEEPNSKEVVMPILIKKRVKPPMDTKRRRVKPPLPTDHRQGCDLTHVNMMCKYCTALGVTNDRFMMKEHLSLEHNSQVPVAIDIRQKDLRKSSRIHMCPMMECTYATYFEEAFLIHLNEEHSDVHFPFKPHIRVKVMTRHVEASPGDSQPPKTETPPAPSLEPVQARVESDVSEAEWESYGKSSSKRRSKGSSDDEPEWTPHSRSRKRRSGRSRRSCGRRDVPSATKPFEPLEMMHDVAQSETTPWKPRPKSSKSSKSVDWMSETISEYPSAQSAVGTRFQCTFCKDVYESLSEVKQHLVDSHHHTSTFCTDLHAKYMRKKQTIFLCRQPACEFCCKTWEALQHHLQNEHEGKVSQAYIRELGLSIAQSPLLRKQTKQSQTRKTEVIQTHSTEASIDAVDDDNESTITGKTQGNSDSEMESMHMQDRGPGSMPASELDDTMDAPMPAAQVHDVKVSTDVDRKSPSGSPLEIPSRKECRKRKGQPRKLTRTPVPESEAVEDEMADKVEAQRESTNDSEEHSRFTSEQEAKQAADVEEGLDSREQEECEDESPAEPEIDLNKKSVDEQNSDSDGHDSSGDDISDDDKNDDVAEDENHATGSSSDSESESETTKVETPIASSPTEKPTDSDARTSGKDDEDDASRSPKSAARATMDVMFQCSHCTYLSTDKDNIQLHLEKEHDCLDPEYTQIGAEFSHDGRVNMSVGEVAKAGSDIDEDDDSENSHNLTKDSSDVHESDAGDASSDKEPSEDHSVSRIEPLKLAIKKTSQGDYSAKKRRKSADSETSPEKSPKRPRNDSENSSSDSSEDSKNDSSDTSEDESSDESSSEGDSESESGSDSSVESKDSSKN